jgi:hypothetical protein
MRWHLRVIAAVILCVANIASLGCRSQPGWSPFCGPGSRVPPPPTGSYGSANTYYQPGVQSVPATVPQGGARVLTTPSSQWSTARDTDPKVATLDTATRFSASTAKSTSSSTSSASSAPRLNGMPVNTIRPANEPEAFTPPDMMTELRSTMSGTKSFDNPVQQASANQSDSVSTSAVSSATWQSRPISQPRPVNR